MHRWRHFERRPCRNRGRRCSTRTSSRRLKRSGCLTGCDDRAAAHGGSATARNVAADDTTARNVAAGDTTAHNVAAGDTSGSHNTTGSDRSRHCGRSNHTRRQSNCSRRTLARPHTPCPHRSPSSTSSHRHLFQPRRNRHRKIAHLRPYIRDRLHARLVRRRAPITLRAHRRRTASKHAMDARGYLFAGVGERQVVQGAAALQGYGEAGRAVAAGVGGFGGGAVDGVGYCGVWEGGVGDYGGVEGLGVGVAEVEGEC